MQLSCGAMLTSTHLSGHTLHLVTFRHVFMYSDGRRMNQGENGYTEHTHKNTWLC